MPIDNFLGLTRGSSAAMSERQVCKNIHSCNVNGGVLDVVDRSTGDDCYHELLQTTIARLVWSSIVIGGHR